MNWMGSLSSPGHLDEAINHLNDSADLEGSASPRVVVSDYLFRALNKIQSEWVISANAIQPGEIKSFQETIINGINLEDRPGLLRSKEFIDFINIRPHILNQKCLRDNGWRPGIEIGPRMLKEATEEHRKAISTYEMYLPGGDESNSDRALKKAAALLYVVRSNIAHGEKSPSGPDIEKAKRDEKVCRVAIPLQKKIINLLLDKPDQKLVVYGTLAPGKPNNCMISDLEGKYEKCVVWGRIEEYEGLPRYTWQVGDNEIEATLFNSRELLRKWDILDRFEGDSYRRRLVPIKINGGISTAYIYASKG